MASMDKSPRADGLPPCWDDDVRMNALFAPCKHHSIAPEAWRQKMTFWSEQLRAWCRRRRSPLVSVTAARDAFARKQTRPACLHVVLDEYVRSGEYVPASTYTSVLTRGGGEGWVRWGARLAFRPAAAAVGVLASYLPFDKTPHDGMAAATIDPDAPYVNQVVVKELSTELLRGWPAGAERVGTLAELMEAGGYEAGGRDVFEVLLGYMITAGLAVKKGELFKLADLDTTKVSPVTECEEALHRLLSAERRLAADAERFRREEERALADTRLALRDGNKTLAKAHLRRKHACASRSGGCDAALDNVRSMLHQLRQAEANSAIVDTYKMSADALKRVMKTEGLDEDSALDTMDELREVMETYSAVEKSLAGTVEEYDAAELEDELEVLLATNPRDGGGAAERGAPPEGRPDKGVPEREFVFDGEARMMAELNELGVPEGAAGAAMPAAGAATGAAAEGARRARGERTAVAVGELAAEEGKTESPKRALKKPSTSKRDWYPPADKSLAAADPNRNAPWQLRRIDNVESMGAAYSLDALSNSTAELRTDPRLHPGQRLENVGAGAGPVMYNTDFQVQDHKLDDGVWIFNAKEDTNPKVRNKGDRNTGGRNTGDRNTGDRNTGGQSAVRKSVRTSETDFSNSTEYEGDSENGNEGYSEEPHFQMAPGGERPSRHERWTDEDQERSFEDLEKRLKNLRSFNK